MNSAPTLLSHLNAAPRASVIPLIGVFRGCGVGPSLVDGALEVLAAVGRPLGVKFQIEFGGVIGEDSVACGGAAFPEEAGAFCADIFSRGGAIFCGPAGGRCVYDLRRRFDLFAKFVPIQPHPELSGVARLAPGHLEGVDILLVRDNIGGVYQGTWGERQSDTGRISTHSFEYREADVRRLVGVAARAAAARRGTLHVIAKDGGVPTVSALWRDAGSAAAHACGVRAEFMNVDFAAYELIQNPSRFDVLATPNLLGDILGDLGGILLSSRGVTFSGNFGPGGDAVYQTAHGCAHDMSGADCANPGGQLLALAMMLRESFALAAAAALIERSLAEVWAQGWRTADIAEPGSRILGTRALVARVAERILLSPQAGRSDERCVTLG